LLYINVYTLFASYSSTYSFPHHLPLPLVTTISIPTTSLWAEPVLPSYSLICRRKIIKNKMRNMTFLVV
jgi:hypothetical protein